MAHRLIKNGELYLYGTVGLMLFFEDGFTDSEVIEALSELDGDVTVHLNSGGGAAFMGVAIHNALKAHEGRITIQVDGIAASAASIIAMAGDDIVMRDGSMLMIHNGSGLTLGTAEAHRKTATALGKLDKSMANIYAKRTGRESGEVKSMMDAETWMTAEEAVEEGFATEWDEDEEAEEATAFDYRLYAKAPERLVAMANSFKFSRDYSAIRAAMPAANQPAKETSMAVTRSGQEKPVNFDELTLDGLKAAKPDLVAEIRAEVEAEAAEAAAEAAAKAKVAEEDEDDKPKKKEDEETGAKAALALLRSPEAKGRHELAVELAEAVSDGDLKLSRAKVALSKSPKVATAALASFIADEAALNLKSAPGGEPEKKGVPQNKDGWTAEFNGSDKLKAEFVTVQDYVAFKTVEARGGDRVLNGRPAR